MRKVLDMVFNINNLTQPELPYDHNSLEPYISSQTLSIHHGRHHKAYVDNTQNIVIANEKYKGMTLQEIIITSYKNNDTALFNNAAQSYNHTMYWHSLSNDSQNPSNLLKEMIEKDFSSIESCKKAFKDAAMSQFGSGWAWLCLDTVTHKLSIMKTGNAVNPMVDGLVPLLTIDVWEHSYYLDFQNKRVSYVDVVVDHLINWSFAESNLNFALAV